MREPMAGGIAPLVGRRGSDLASGRRRAASGFGIRIGGLAAVLFPLSLFGALATRAGGRLLATDGATQYAGLGEVAGLGHQDGAYVSIQGSF